MEKKTKKLSNDRRIQSKNHQFMVCEPGEMGLFFRYFDVVVLRGG